MQTIIEEIILFWTYGFLSVVISDLYAKQNLVRRVNRKELSLPM